MFDELFNWYSKLCMYLQQTVYVSLLFTSLTNTLWFVGCRREWAAGRPAVPASHCGGGDSDSDDL